MKAKRTTSKLQQKPQLPEKPKLPRKQRTVWTKEEVDGIGRKFWSLLLKDPSQPSTEILKKAQQHIEPARQRKITGLSVCEALHLRILELGEELLKMPDQLEGLKEANNQLSEEITVLKDLLQQYEQFKKANSLETATTDALISTLVKRFVPFFPEDQQQMIHQHIPIHRPSSQRKAKVTATLVGGSTVRDYPLLREALDEEQVDLRIIPSEGNGQFKLNSIQGLKSRDFIIFHTGFAGHCAESRVRSQIPKDKFIRWDGDRGSLQYVLRPIHTMIKKLSCGGVC